VNSTTTLHDHATVEYVISALTTETNRLIGTEDVIEIDSFDQTFTYTRDTGDSPGIESVFWGTNMDKRLIHDLIEAVRVGRKPVVSGEEGVREVRVVEAAYRSAEEAGAISIQY
jgi:predicted dehydrogenase